MSKAQLDRNDLPVEAVEKLNEILVQDAENLNEEDAAFLRARRGYLNSSEKERFAVILGEQTADVGGEVDPPASTGVAPQEVPLTRMNKTQLLAKAAELCIKDPEIKEKSNKDLVAIIESNLA